MSLSDFSTLIIAMATIVYTIGTFLLWKVTKRSFNLSVEESRLTQKRIKADLLASMVSWHRDIYTYILSREPFVKIISKAEHINKNELEAGLLASLFINHTLQAYYHYKQGNLDEEMWSMMEKDIMELFNWPFVKKRWIEIKRLHLQEFQDYIERKILKEKNLIKEEVPNEK